mgnify:CR=1 FL=1
MSGDLVYCKGESTEKVTGISCSECEGDSFYDTYECSQLDEISETVLPEEKSNSVKVWCFNFLSYISWAHS